MTTTVTDRLGVAPVGRLATTSGGGAIHLVPVCFALVADRVVGAVDHKPKRTQQLRRLQDIRETGRAVLLIDHYDDDWSKLWWIRVTGAATVHEGDEVDRAARAALADKYRQYRQVPPTGPVWSLTLDEVTWWAATSETFRPERA
jgi:PPOX class probable F420-dependent enzyme